MAKKLSLVEKAKAIQPKPRKDWTSKLEPVVRKEIMLLREMYHKGQLSKHATASDLWALIVEEYPGIKIVQDCTFRNWLNKK